MVEIAERLIGKGIRLKIYDRNVSLARLTGANEKFIHDHLPHIGELLIDDLNQAVDGAELVVLGNSDPAFADVAKLVPADMPVIDLVRIVSDPTGLENYQGLGW
jgi:GDP-mannose 6-dehydrogenase